MRIVIISDTHSKHDIVELPEGDVLVHSGDFTRCGSYEDVLNFAKWMNRQNFAHRICVAGNHDLCLESTHTHKA